MEDNKDYVKIKQQAEEFYKRIGKIKCSALNDLVYFNSEGFNHLIFKNKSERTQKEQIVKFRFLDIAKEIIEISTTYQEYDEGLIEVVVKNYGKKSKKVSMVKYWGLVAIIRGCRVKAIVRQVGNGNKHFWSVMPTWGINHYRETKIISKSKGNLSED